MLAVVWLFPCRSPALIGCFIVDREYFQEIGLLDEGMEVYGGENVELGIRVRNCQVYFGYLAGSNEVRNKEPKNTIRFECHILQ